MYPVLTQCPVCGGEMIATRLKCHGCDVAVEGAFSLGPLARLTPEQWAFVETFIRCEGKITRMEKELNISYPTVRARLDDLILALGYQPRADDEDDADEEIEADALTEEERRQVLDDLAAGLISSEEAVVRLRAV